MGENRLLNVLTIASSATLDIEINPGATPMLYHLIRSILATLAIVGMSVPTASAQATARVSVASSGNQGNQPSYAPSISFDGRFVAFHSPASNLVPGDTNTYDDIFVHDRQTGETRRVSVDSSGIQANSTSGFPSVSAEARFVAYESLASNLTPGDTNSASDIFVHDRLTGQTTRVSVDSGGLQGNAGSSRPRISSDGRHVAFESQATNLSPGDTNNFSDIFVHDRQTGQTTRVSVDSGGAQGNHYSVGPSISADGSFVAFYALASNLVPNDTNGTRDVFVHNRQTAQTTLVSVSSGGVQGNRYSTQPSISSDGRFVAFASVAFNLVPGDSNFREDIFVHDRQTGQTTRVSVDSLGVEGNNYSFVPNISSDGRFVAFESPADNLVPGDTNNYWDIFVHDRQTGQTTRASVDSGGAEGNGSSNYSSVSSDGRFVAFHAGASNLVPGDTNRYVDVFVRDSQTITPALSAQGSCPGLLTLTLDAATPERAVAFALGAAGSFTLTSSVCAGTILDIANPQLGPVIRATWLGTIERTYQIAPALCGLTVQAVDIQTCKTSNTVVL